MTRVVIPILLATILAIAGWNPSVAWAAQNTCEVEAPCPTGAQEQGADLVFRWEDSNGFDHFNVRWARPGRASEQIELDGSARHYAIGKFRRNTEYTFSIQGCHKPWLHGSTCSSWIVETYVTCGAPRRPCSGPPPARLRSGAGLCLDVDWVNQRRNGTKVQVWACNEHDQQLWTLRDGVVRSLAGKCLEVFAPDLRKNGGRVQVWDCNGTVQQRWQLRGTRLVNGGGKCLDVPAHVQRTNGTPLQVWECNTYIQQRWSVDRSFIP